MSNNNLEHVFIGDIHGHAPTLLALLDQLGWKYIDGRLTNPGGQQLVFVGDLIDRGPENLRTVEIVRDLVERGHARCLMGNHEYNAVQFHTQHPDQPGQYLREQSPKNIAQHRAVLEEIERRPGDWQEMLNWFRTLPLALEGESWRCVHACWHPDHLKTLQQRGDGWYLHEDHWVAASTENTPEYNAVETLLKGPEMKLPDNAFFTDKDGNQRTHARLRWWTRAPATLEDALLFQTRPDDLDMTKPYENLKHLSYPQNAKPVFFGHYWRSGEIAPERPNAACLDYSVGKGDRLVAYRHGGSATILNDRFHAQSVRQG